MQTTKLRSKVVEIEAMRFTGGIDNAVEIVSWVIGSGGHAIWWKEDDRQDESGAILPEHIEVVTLDSKGRVFVGDWMLRGLKGEFYPCKDDTKVEKYDEIGDFEDTLISTEEPTA